MSRNIRHSLHSNILIVCEGEVTEPEYLALLKRMALIKGIWSHVEIKPKPRSEEDETDKSSPLHKTPRVKRQLINVVLHEDADDIEIECGWRQTPVKYVKEARDGLKEGVYQEAWAIFDLDGHPAQPQAFRLAAESVNGNVVNIAFSSIAFEHWILLHFEKNNTAFLKSDCKQESKYLQCGTGNHPDDCWGERCASGYMRLQTYLSGSTKGHNAELITFLSCLLSDQTRYQAYENAAWLRANVDYDPERPYLTNPWTNVDMLVKRLMGEDEMNIQWGDTQRLVLWENLEITFVAILPILNLTLKNVGNETSLFNGASISLCLTVGDERIDFTPHDTHLKILAPQSIQSYSFPISETFSGGILEFSKGNSRLCYKIGT